MGKILNFGSLNVDHVYAVEHFVQPGETLSSTSYQVFCGGKGLNQSVAAARAGAEVFHAGVLGAGGEMLEQYLLDSGVHTEYLRRTGTPQGHTVIQISPEGENCIILAAGSNAEIRRADVDAVLERVSPPCWLLVQNETSEVPYLIEAAARRGLQTVLNASPFQPSLLELDYRNVTWLMINEVEGAQYAGSAEPEAILAHLRARYPGMGVVLTLGSAGCICVRGSERAEHGIFRVPVVDTTGAGDTFTGYFIAALSDGAALSDAVELASAASALAVSARGAAPSIPTLERVRTFLRERRGETL